MKEKPFGCPEGTAGPPGGLLATGRAEVGQGAAVAGPGLGSGSMAAPHTPEVPSGHPFHPSSSLCVPMPVPEQAGALALVSWDLALLAIRVFLAMNCSVLEHLQGLQHLGNDESALLETRCAVPAVLVRGKFPCQAW